MFVQTVDMPKKFEHLRTRLNIEEARLLNWGENVGLVEELLDRPSQAFTAQPKPDLGHSSSSSVRF
jgi:hypothetical protein